MVTVPVHSPSVELCGVSKRYGDVRAVDGISLVIEPGEFITLLGPSGCGKTTTLRMIGGFEYPDSGSIRINGEMMGNRPPHKRPVNTVFQNYALFPHMTVGQNIGYGLEMAGVPKKERLIRVGEALELVRLPHVERRKPHELSGGQQQRVALARALVNKPQVLLLDEPLGALDLKLRKAMQLELKSLNREVGVTFVYVTHDQEEALTMSDRIAVMSQGRILQLGQPEDIYERPRSTFVADFIGQTNLLSGHLLGMEDGLASIDLAGAGVIRAVTPHGGPSADDVQITVRPEKITMTTGREPAPSGDGWNTVPGVIHESVYLGTHTQFVVRLESGSTVIVHRQNLAQRSEDLRSGAPVVLAFDPQSASVLGE
jgi:spermidine/putrescine transport system ATP-binding protein